MICLLAACARSTSAVANDVFVPVSRGDSSSTLANFQPDIPAVDGLFECAPPELIGRSGVGRELLGSDAVSYSAYFPNRAETRATVVVFVDSVGKIIRYAERRGPSIQPKAPRGAEPTMSAAGVAAAAAAVRSTTISLDLRTGRG